MSEENKRTTKDWAGFKFKLMKEQGECIDIIYIKHSLLNHSQEFFLKPHDLADGSSALAQIANQEDNLEIESLPVLRHNKKPNLLMRVLLAIKHLHLQKPRNYSWKLKTKKIGTSAGLSYIIFPPEISQIIDKKSKENGYNTNSLLLRTLDKVSRQELLSPKNSSKEKTVWMVPVNMRTKLQAHQFSGNFVTTLSVHITPTDTIGSIYKQISSLMKSGIIWGGWIIANTPKFIGEKRLRKISKNMKSPYFGLCSNLGSWPPEHAKNESSQHHQWIPVSPVTRFCPVSTVILKWNDSYSLSCQLHPSISNNLKDTEQLVDKWGREILKEFNLTHNNQIHTVAWDRVESNAQYF